MPKAQARRLLSQDPIPVLPGHEPPSPVTGPLLLESPQKLEPKRASTAVQTSLNFTDGKLRPRKR